MQKEKIFEYNGPSQKFKEAFDNYGAQLGQFYKSILPKKEFEDFTRLFSPEIYFTLQGNNSEKMKESDSISNLFQDSDFKDKTGVELFALANELIMLEENYVRELDNRALSYLGFDPEKWINREDIIKLSAIAPHAARRMNMLKSLEDEKLVEKIKTWQDRAAESEDQRLYNLNRSFKPIKIHKLSPYTIENYKEFFNLENAYAFAVKDDNISMTAVLSPSMENIILNGDYSLKIKGTSHIKTTIGILLSELNTGTIIKDTVNGSNIPPYLVPIIHETNHVLSYSMAKLPLGLLSGILIQNALRKE